MGIEVFGVSVITDLGVEGIVEKCHTKRCRKPLQAAQPKMMEIMTELVNRFLTTRQPQHIMMPAAVVGYVPTPAGINNPYKSAIWTKTDRNIKYRRIRLDWPDYQRVSTG